MITVHEENHLAELRKLSKADRKSGMLVTLDEFKEDIFSSFYCASDCSARWACMYEDDAYEGNDVSFNVDRDTEEVEWVDKPDWATHVIWFSK